MASYGNLANGGFNRLNVQALNLATQDDISKLREEIRQLNENIGVNTGYIDYAADYINKLPIDAPQGPYLLDPSNLHGHVKGYSIKLITNNTTVKFRNMIPNHKNNMLVIGSNSPYKAIYLLKCNNYKDPSFITLSQNDLVLLKGSTVADLIKMGDVPRIDDETGEELGGLNHAICMRTINEQCYLFASSESAVFCWKYDIDNETISDGRILINNLNMGSRTDIRPNDAAAGNHKTRELVFDTNGNLYVQVGSALNLDDSPYRSQIKKLSYENLVNNITNKKSVDFITLEVHAMGLRNVVGMCNGPASKSFNDDSGKESIWGVNMGFDFLQTVNPNFTLSANRNQLNITTDNSKLGGILTDNTLKNTGEELFLDNNPGDTLHELLDENAPTQPNTNISKYFTDSTNSNDTKLFPQYGYPYLWNSTNNLTQSYENSSNTVQYKENQQFLTIPDVLERPGMPRSTNALISDDSKSLLSDSDHQKSFVTKQSKVLGPHVAPIGISFNYEDPNNEGKILYDGKTDQTLLKTKSIDDNFGVITYKGSWNKEKPSGNKVVSFSCDGKYNINDLFFNELTFQALGSRGISTVLPLPGADPPAFKDPQWRYRPTGVTFNLDGTMFVSSDPSNIGVLDPSTPPTNQTPSIVAIFPN